MRKALVAWLVVVGITGGSIFTASDVFAADFDVSIETSVVVSRIDELVKISGEITITNNVDADTPVKIEIPTIGTGIKAITAGYSKNASKINSSYDEETKLLTLNTTRSNKGKGKSWTIAYSYSTDLINNLGSSDSIVWPATPPTISMMSVVKEVRRFELDLGLGVINRIGRTKPQSSLEIGRQILIWQEKSNIEYATGVVFGDSSLIDVTVSTKLKNNGFWWKNFIVVLPPDTNQQKVVVTELTPKPRSVRVDVDGNILAEYRLGPKSSLEVEAKATILVKNFTYALASANDKLTDEEKSKLATYTKVLEKWQPRNLEIDNSATDVDTLREILNQTSQQDLETTGSDDFSRAVGSNDYFIGAARSFGIPTRAVRGIISDGGEQRPHAWAESYISGLGWITVDSLSDTKNFLTADSRYVALLIRGENDSHPPSRVTETSVEYKKGDSLPTYEDKIIVASRTYMILPGIGIRIAKVEFPRGFVLDNTVLVFEDERQTELGSVAPLQTAVSRDPVLGPSAFSTQLVTFGNLNAEGEINNLAEVVSTISWKPFILLVILLVLAVVAFIIWRKRDSLGFNLSFFKTRKKRIKMSLPDTSHASIESDRLKTRETERPRRKQGKLRRPNRRNAFNRIESREELDLPSRSIDADGFRIDKSDKQPPRKKPPTLIQ